MSSARSVTRESLERDLTVNALDLFHGTGAHAFVLPVPNTNPPLFIACGEKEQINNLLGTLSENASVDWDENRRVDGSKVLDCTPPSRVDKEQALREDDPLSCLIDAKSGITALMDLAGDTVWAPKLVARIEKLIAALSVEPQQSRVTNTRTCKFYPSQQCECGGNAASPSDCT